MNKNLNNNNFEERILNILNLDSIKKENEKIILNLSQFNKIELIDKDLLKDESNYLLKIQNHEFKDRDIKLDMKKIDSYNLKLIYHRKKDNEKEYRLFLSFKENDNLKRIRMINSQIKEIQNSEKDMIELFSKIQKNDIDKFLKEKIS
nr:MAG TPA: hypothetical protein [Caudoviricetes sp.]